MSANLPVHDDELQAYADNQLGSARAEDVAAALAREPLLAARVAEIRRQNAALRDAFDPWLAEALPRKLLWAATGRSLRGRWRWQPWAALAASVVLGVGVGWFGRGEMLQLAGMPFDADSILLRGDPAEAKFAVFHLKGDLIQAVEAVNAPAEFMGGKLLIGQRRPIDRARLADVAVSMKEVAAA